MKILNLDKLLPEPKIIQMNEKEYVFKKIPSKFTLIMSKISAKDPIDVLFPVLHELFNIVAGADFPEKWVEENLTLEEIQSIIGYLFSKSEESDEKNEKSLT